MKLYTVWEKTGWLALIYTFRIKDCLTSYLKIIFYIEVLFEFESEFWKSYL